MITVHTEGRGEVTERTGHADTFARDRLPPRELWPDLRFELPDLRYPPRLNCGVELLRAGRPDAPALMSPAETLTYAELADRVDRYAHVLVDDLALVPGGRVLLRAPNTPTLVACWLAVVKAGGIAVTTMPLLRPRELRTMLERAEVEIALCDARVAADLEAAAAGTACRTLCLFGGDRGPETLEARAATKSGRFAAVDTAADDIVLIAFTSGTTGEPKGTMHFHRDVLAVCDTFSSHVLKPLPTDVFVGSPPIAFTFGLGGSVLFPLRAGAASLLLESGAADPLVDAIEAFRATVLFTAPTAYRQILSSGAAERVRSLRRCVSAGETLPRSVFDAWRDATGLAIIDGIGATELLHIFISASDDDIRPGATGRPVPGYEARVVDDEMRDVAPGEPGRLAVRGPTGCRYLDDDRQSSYVVDGWNITGDTYVRDDDGYFWYQARSDDMIVTSGFNVAAPEVEEVLLEHAAVDECAVVGVPDPVRGSIVKAFVVVKPGTDPGAALVAELQTHVKSALAPYKYPRAVEFVDALPRTATGKVQRNALRAS